MKSIRCLIFDDSSKEIAMIERILKSYWSEIQSEKNHVPDLECTPVTEEGTLLQLIDNSPSFDLFLCDILVPDASGKAQMTGVNYIREGKLGKKIPVVAAMTSGPDSDNRGNFITAITNAGCDLIVEKSNFLHHDGKATTRKIVRLLEREGRLLYRGQLKKEPSQENSPELLAVFGKIGEDTLSAISSYFCVNETAEKVFLSVLRPGLSGADVIRAHYTSPQVNLKNRRVLFKVSRDVKKLEIEVRKYRDEIISGRVIDSALTVPFIDKEQPYVVAGWGALGIQFENDSRTFLSWLSDEQPDTITVTDVLTSLFLSYGLTDTYKDNKTEVDIDAISAIKNALLTPYRLASIGAAIRELRPLVEKYRGDVESNLQSLEDFLTSGTLSAVNKDKIGTKTIFCTQHGDLHARNVLVASNGNQHRPKIIDYANIESMPWSADIARLLVDIAIDGINHGVEGYEWDNLKCWDYLIKLFIDGKITLSEDKHTVTHKAIEWLRKNLFTIYDVEENNQHMAEYCLTLAIELMRASYKKNELPAPKRAFALVAAAAAIERAEQEFLKVKLQ